MKAVSDPLSAGSERGTAPTDGIPFPREEFEGSLVARFRKVASAIPASTAVAGTGRHWSYAEFDAWTDRIARAVLQRVEAGPGFVAYCTEHAPQMAACAYGILKSGKAYLCIHPGLPIANAREQLQASGIGLVVADAASFQRAVEIARGVCPLVALDDIGSGGDSMEVACEPGADDPAVLFYTSGSTGRPKAVVKSHRALLHRAWLCAVDEVVRPGDRQSLVTYCSFGSSEGDLHGGLLNGASVFLFDVLNHGFPEFREWIDRESITLLHPPVALFRRYLRWLDGSHRHGSVRLVALAGEAMGTEELAAWRRTFGPGCALHLRFSSTECGNVALGRIRPGEAPPVGGAPPLAYAVTDKHLTVVDPAGHPVPPGEPGELVVRSAYLSESSIPTEDAASALRATRGRVEREFRTGDLGRLHADGGFEFLGRRDSQVKIRGYRVELGEIERALTHLSGVREAAAVAVEERGEYRLLGFVTLDPGAAVAGDALRTALRGTLPDWKIPAAVHPVDQFPLTTNGKIDRRRLPSLIHASPPRVPDSEPVLPVDADPCRAIIGIWESLLGRRGIEPEDDFFNLGGHSLMAAEMMVAVGAHFGVSLPVRLLREHSSPRALAAVATGARAIQAAPVGDPPGCQVLREGASASPLILVPFPGGSEISYLPLVRQLRSDGRVCALEFTPDMAADDVTRIAAQFIAVARKWVDPARGFRLCGYSSGGVIAWEMARQLRAAGSNVELLALIDSRVPGSLRLLPAHRRVLPHARLVIHHGRFRGTAYLLDRLGSRLLRIARRLGVVRPAPAISLADLSVVDQRRELLRRFQPLPYAGPVLLLRTLIRTHREWFYHDRPVNGWERLCDRIEFREVPGTHGSVIKPPNVAEVARLLDEAISRGGTAGAQE